MAKSDTEIRFARVFCRVLEGKGLRTPDAQRKGCDIAMRVAREARDSGGSGGGFERLRKHFGLAVFRTLRAMSPLCEEEYHLDIDAIVQRSVSKAARVLYEKR